MDERSTWPLVCSCGESWTAVEWEELPLVGTYNAGTEGKLELRRCVCGATLTIPAPAPEK